MRAAVIGRRPTQRTGRRAAARAAALLATIVLTVACQGRPGRTLPRPSPAVSTSTTVAPVSVTAAVGDKITLPGGATVQVFGYTPNATPSNAFSKPAPGMAFATVDVEGCAGGQPPPKDGVVNPFFFTLLLPGASPAQASIPVKDPGLAVGPQAAGACIRGFVTFEVPADAKPTAVAFHTAAANLTWTIH